MKSMNVESCTKLVQEVAGGQASTYGASSKLAEALVKGELTVAVLDKALSDALDDKPRQMVEQAIRMALGRITGKVDKEGKLTGKPKMTINRSHGADDGGKENKSLQYVEAPKRAVQAPAVKTDTSGKASGPADAEKEATEGNKLNVDLYHNAIVGNVAKFCGIASLAQREALAKAVIKVLTVDGQLYINAPEVGQTADKVSKVTQEGVDTVKGSKRGKRAAHG